MYESIFIIINYKRNANQNNSEIPFTTVRLAVIEKTTNDGKGKGEKETPIHHW
jgi:hypothetical protein